MQGFNMGRYYPPDADNAPSFNQTSHPLGARARKLNQGILTVRFELPFAVWCSSCSPPAIIGQGVRFNAEKKKVGNYYSTPVWGFRMKHSACGAWWEIRTDPARAEYVCFEGCRRREYGDAGAKEEGELAGLGEEERERRREDAFAGLEGRLGEKGREERGRERVVELFDAGRVWERDWEVNRRLRDGFRVGRKEAEREGREREALKEKFGLGVEVLGEVEGDRVRAGLVEFRGKEGDEGDVVRRGLFESGGDDADAEKEGHGERKKLKREVVRDKSRRELRHALVSNTRAAIDPFLQDSTPKPKTKSSLGLLKRKRDVEAVENGTATSMASTQRETNTAKSKSKLNPSPPTPASHLPALVHYDSD